VLLAAPVPSRVEAASSAYAHSGASSSSGGGGSAGSVVLVLPRGNLEAISPRLLLLAAVVDALSRGEHSTAWSLAVSNRCV
jgi:hypothetical protein